MKGKPAGQSKKLLCQKIENAQQNKCAETGVNICDPTVRNNLNEIGFISRKAKRKR